ncbi:hypothetical protein [Nonomuraea sp. NPDC003709]|uniref:hypothetical protein n=1 Tax=Nonomuraea sp. NPDC003709 TaxID=3154450 RepID=UPI0033A2A49E
MAPDPGQVHTAAELAVALKELAGGRSYAELDRAAQPDRLPKGTLTDMFGKGRPSEETLGVFLRACGIPREEQAAWGQARKRALTTDPVFEGLIRVAQVDPRRLGVHAPIDAPDAIEDMPVYVRRDVDDGPRGVRDLVNRAAQRGGLVVLVGGSSVGKTRCAYEAIRELLPQWWLLHPADACQVERAATSALGRLVVWLDELQRYLDGSHPLTAATVRNLLHRRAVVIATLWPDRFATYTLPPESKRIDPHAGARELLGLAEVVHFDAELSKAEQERAHTAAAGDARIKLGLESSDYGLFQVIAAAPQLIDRWRGADAYATAVLTAAVDATRLGVHSPLSAELLRDAAPGYCDARQRGAAPANWFEASLAYLTQELHGATAALAPIALPGSMGRPVGYQLADYLQQHLGRRRRDAKVPAATWRALALHLTDPDDRTRTCAAALDRLLYDYILRALPPPPHTGDPATTARVAMMLAGQGRVEEALFRLRPCAASSDWHGDYGSWLAATALGDLLAEHGCLEELRARADVGDRVATSRLADLLASQGRIEELSARADTGDWDAAWNLTELLVKQGEEEKLRARADAGDLCAVKGLADLLAKQGSVEEAIAILRPHASCDSSHPLTGHVHTEVLRSAANVGTLVGPWIAASRLADLLVRQGREDELRARADAGDLSAVKKLADLLAKQGSVEEAIALLRPHADRNESHASRLAKLLVRQGREDELHARADAGDGYAARSLVHLLYEQGREDELHARADAGDGYAASLRVGLLVDQGRVDELRARVEAGDGIAALRLADALERVGQVAEGERVRRFGLPLNDD